MNKKRCVVTVLASILCICAITGCSAKKKDPIAVFTGLEHRETYVDAAKMHFSSTISSNGDYRKEDFSKPKEVGNLRMDPPRYVVVISDSEEILDSEPIEGKLYSVFVHDNGSDDIKIRMRYNVGTSDNCVIKGKVTSGEFAYDQTLEISAAGISDTSRRASLILDGLYEAWVDIEGK